jgi:hypothetical protein
VLLSCGDGRVVPACCLQVSGCRTSGAGSMLSCLNTGQARCGICLNVFWMFLTGRFVQGVKVHYIQPAQANLGSMASRSISDVRQYASGVSTAQSSDLSLTSVVARFMGWACVLLSRRSSRGTPFYSRSCRAWNPRHPYTQVVGQCILRRDIRAGARRWLPVQVGRCHALLLAGSKCTTSSAACLRCWDAEPG